MTMTLEPTRASHLDDAPPASSVPSAGIIDFNAPATAGLVMYECQRVRTDLGVRTEAMRAELIERIDGTRAELIERINGTRTDLSMRIEAVRAELIERIEGLRAEMYRLVNRQTLQILGIMITLLTAQTALLLALL
ncbi:MAG: hypothetical protein ACKOE7_14300 [Actinomycetota bacterium]